MELNKEYLVLLQSRKDSNYNDFVGKFYHFPKKFYNLLSQDNISFIYYEPPSKGSGTYFGCGEIGRIFEDKREKDCFFAEILNYKEFTDEIPFENEASKREEGETYNPQNSVRRIDKETFEGICLDGGVLLNFQADAHLIKVLGEELIASEKIGLLELIKNSYDAQASRCKVRIEKIPSIPEVFDKSIYEFPDLDGPVFIIEDDGIGMDWDVIQNGWLRPASTIKTSIKERIKEENKKALERNSIGTLQALRRELKKLHKGRIPLGEKGVGRFAAQRLGKKLKLITKKSDKSYEYVLEIDWDKFTSYENALKDLNSIGVSLKRQEVSREYGKNNSGTCLIIYGGKENFSWNRDSLVDLHNSISALITPYPSKLEKNKSNQEQEKNFDAYLECPQLPDLPARIQMTETYPPSFTLDAIVDMKGLSDFTINFNPPPTVPFAPEIIEKKNVDLKNSDFSYWNKNNPVCGSFYMHLDVWYRTEPWISGPDKRDCIQYLSDFGGVSIFRDGINVYSAELGTASDWLKLSERHIKQGYRISYYNFIGNIEIDQVENISLTDKTNREGLIENKASKDLAQLVRTLIITYLETEFIAKRDKYTKFKDGVLLDSPKMTNAIKTSKGITSNILMNYPVEEDPHKILLYLGNPQNRRVALESLESSLKNLQESLKHMEEVKDLLAEQAGYGLSIAVSVHELAKIASNFYNGVTHLFKTYKGNKELESRLSEISDYAKSFRNELNRMAPLRATRNENSVVFKISKAINFVTEVYQSKTKALGINIICENNKDFEVYARYGVVLQVFSNLFNNSIYWLQNKNITDKEIKIVVDSDNRELIVADSGSGIDDFIMRYLFEPGYSLKVPPSGLGLYICKYYMRSIKGDINLTPNKDRIKDMPGAQFTLDFSRVIRKE
ncbi:MAG: ATP-binding protein [Endomicrobiaceae bacterium]